MLTELISIHQQVVANAVRGQQRYLYPQVNWRAQAVCIFGARGTGKTTLMCQSLLAHYPNVEEGLYLSADNIVVLSHGLFKIAQAYFAQGGQALFIDEVHKYPNWSVEIKNIIDTYRNRKVVFSASSSLDLQKSKADLSRRVVYYELRGLSFREYLNFTQNLQLPALRFEQILEHHVKLSQELQSLLPLKHFNHYLQYGFYPFFLEGIEDYLAKLTNVIEKVIFEDIAVVYNLKQTTLPVLKKILWLVATSGGLVPNIDRISKSLAVSRDVIYNCLAYLGQSDLLKNIYPHAQGMKLIRKPGKVFLDNTNLLAAINGTLKLDSDKGHRRETFFANQVTQCHRVNLHEQADFIVDGKYVIEVGGTGKNFKQIKAVTNSYLAIDQIEIGFGKKVPLYLFGMLY